MYSLPYGFPGYVWTQAHPTLFFLGVALLALWSLAWKGWALWTAARRGDRIWFIVFLIVNTAGILEIIYLYFFAGRRLRPVHNPHREFNG